jgi:uncharacterized protein (DUF2252 family)
VPTKTDRPAARPGPEQSIAAGKAARARVPLASQRDFDPGPSRDPIGLLLDQARSRIPELVPVRHARMLVSPFTFFRGAALPMAADLATTPSAGFRVQLCGDAHLSNFGAFGSPERRLVFDVNDFDETLPGPFEWDVKRLVASLVVAGRDNGFAAADSRRAALGAAARYRKAMRDFTAMSTLAVWYAHLDVEDTIARFKSQLKKSVIKKSEEVTAKARTRDSTQALAKLTRVGADGQREIISDPPLIVPLEELSAELSVDASYAALRSVASGYTSTLPSDRQHLLGRFRLTRVARKVVGVGSVGTQAWILLMDAEDGLDPLLLQAKQAERSVLAAYAGESQYDHQGERVVAGQQLMQAASDIFLGWQRVTEAGGTWTDYYVRQLRDWKYSAPIERLDPDVMADYGQLCGWTLARAHARSGDRFAIAAYLGGSPKFDEAVADFGESYADQTERDHAAFAAAAASGRVQAAPSV